MKKFWMLIKIYQITHKSSVILDMTSLMITLNVTVQVVECYGK